ncbi:MAG: hypothetical protein GQ531_09240 [Sulfurovum sp.]|nr:hypothetical protein [Sulfurovum sp.]
MKKYILLIGVILTTLNAWEINTHRAFDKEALKNVPNLNKFVENANVENENYANEKFEGYERIDVSDIKKRKGLVWHFGY